jgi:hypothetical protein
LLIIDNKTYYDSNYVEIKLSDFDILTSTPYSASSVQSVISTIPQTLSDIASEPPPACDVFSLTSSSVQTQ